MSNIVIDLKNVDKSFGSLKAVKNLYFQVSESACFGLLGPNGAGKSTTMKMIYGVCERDPNLQSSISVFGIDPQKNSLAIKYLSGVVPQENNLDEELNVEQNLQIYSKFYGMPFKQASKRIKELLDFMELADKQKAKIRALSGGMKRRLIIARALLHNPKLLILDEPTTGLDPQVRHLIWEKLRDLKHNGITILLTTHYMEEAFQICDSILILNKSERIMEGSPQVLVKNNIEPFVLEIYSKNVFVNIRDKAQQECTRIDEKSGIVRIYSCNESHLRGLAQMLNPGDYFFRQSNLEDLFLKATGSSLNDLQ